MFDFIKTQFKTGDFITLHCANGSYTGAIAFISDDTIVLKLSNGGMCGIKGSDITFFETPQAADVASSTESGLVQKSENATVTPTENSAKVSETCVDSSPMKEITAVVDVKTESRENRTEPKAKPIEFKVGDVIPLDKLTSIDPSIGTRTRIKEPKKKMVSLNGGFDALESLVKDQHDADNQKLVPPRGEIKWVDINRNFGFIKDTRTNQDVYFNFNQIVDPNLRAKVAPYTPVDYSTAQYSQGLQANCVHFPKKVAELLELAKSLSEKGEHKSALEVVKHILDEYPDNFDASKYESQLKKLVPSYQQKNVEYSNAYTKAKKYHSEKNYEKAIEYYQKAIEKHEKVDSAIKDLGMLYGSLYKSESVPDEKERYRKTAQEFMEENEHFLAKNMSSYNFLESFYYTIHDFDNFVNIVNIMLDEDEVVRDNKRRSLLLCKKAAAFLQMNEIDKAYDVIDECLDIDPNNLSAQKLRAIINEGNSTEDIESIFSATSFDNLNSGLSPFIDQTVDNYTEYAGVPAKVLESGDFDKSTLKGIRALIDRFHGRHRERAKYLLTEAKLMTDIEPNDVARFRSVMARYCNSMALTHISDNSPMDITRFYYNEAFALEQSWDKTRRQVSLFLLTYCCGYSTLLNASTQDDYSVAKSLSTMIKGDFDAKKWEGILSMTLYNSEISAQLFSILYSDSSLKAQSLLALRYFGQDSANINTKEDFVFKWNNARDSRIRDYKKTINDIKSIGDVSNIEEVAQHLYNLHKLQADWINALV